MRIFRGVHPFNHYPWVPADDDDAHGNLGGALAAPVARKAIAFFPTGNSQSREPVTAEHAARYLSRLTMLVEDGSPFTHRDEVEIGGTRYEVDGDPAEGDWSKGPFPMVNKLFGAEIHLVRVG